MATAYERVMQLRPDAVTWREVDGEVVALDLQAGEYLTVNVTGAALWKLLSTGATRATLANHLVQLYGLDGPRAESDVATFVTSLHARELLDERPVS